MATEFKIPNLGDGIKGGDVLNVLVKVGDTVAKDQGVLELETDKATIEVPSPAAGTIAELLAEAGDTVHVGPVIARMITGNGAAPTAQAPEPSAAPRPQGRAPPPPNPGPLQTTPAAPRGAASATATSAITRATPSHLCQLAVFI